MRSTVENQSDHEKRSAYRISLPLTRPLTSRDVAALLSDTGPASRAARAVLKASPSFPMAIRQSAKRLSSLHSGNRILNLILSDRGRLFVSMFALDLHFRRAEHGIGLTPGRLKAICREQNVCSGTRAGALLALLSLGGYIERAPAKRDRRRREFIPTQKLIANLRKRWQCHLSGAAMMLPEAVRALDHLDRPELIEGVVGLISAYYCAGFRFTDHCPSLRLFADRNGGLMVLFACLAATERSDSGTPLAAAVSISELARGICTSRAHVATLLKEAESEGLVRRTRAGEIVLLPALVADLHEFFALNYLLLTHLASLTLDAAGETYRSRSTASALSATPPPASVLSG